MQKLQAKESLKPYESDNYVFHGSSIGTILELEPRQSYSFGKPDGEPAISASRSIQPAIFMALFSKGFGSAMGTFPTNDNPFGMVISQSAWEKVQTDNSVGFVYVLNANNFTFRDKGGWELRAIKTVIPLAVVEVTKNDLPDGITVKKDDEILSYLDSFRSSFS